MRCSWLSPPVTTLRSSRPPERFWKVPAICAARNGEVKPGRDATRNFSRSDTWLSMVVDSQASSHQAPVGVSAASKPASSAARATWPRYDTLAGRPAGAAPTPCPPPTTWRPSPPLVGRNQWNFSDMAVLSIDDYVY